MVGVAITFSNEIQSRNYIIEKYNLVITEQSQSVSASPVVKTDFAIQGLNTTYLVQQIQYYLNRYSTTVVFIWILVFLVRFFFILAGIHQIRLRRQSSWYASISWQVRLEELAKKIGVTQQFHLLESGMITVPMVIGYCKPVIVIPFGLICRLPVAELESILLHELAHIRRRDFLVNLIQSLSENIFFFHPCILWISSLIREERENCCDDIAVTATNDREQYIHALISFQEYNLTATSASLIAFAGTRYRLLDRVRRLLNHENKKLNQMEKMILLGSMVVLTSICVITSNDTQAQQRERTVRERYKRDQVVPENRENMRKQELLSANEEFKHVSTKTSDDDGERYTSITVTDGEGRRYMLKKLNEEIQSLSINGKEIEGSDLSEYDEIIEKIEQASTVASEKAKQQKLQSRQKRMQSDPIREQGMTEADMLAKERFREEETYHRGREKMMLQEQKQHENERRNYEMRERSEALKAKQLYLRELQRHNNQHRNRTNKNDEGEDDNDEVRLEKHENQKEYKQHLQERMQERQRNTDQSRSNMELQALREKLESNRELHETEAGRNAEQRQRQRELLDRQNERNMEMHKRQLERMAEQSNEQQQSMREQLMYQQDALMYQQEALKLRSRAQNDQNQNILLQKLNATTRRDEISAIIEILEEEEIIDSRVKLSFTLNEENLIVNGRKQSSELHDRLKDKYIQNSGDHFIYFKDGQTTRTTIQRNR